MLRRAVTAFSVSGAICLNRVAHLEGDRKNINELVRVRQPSFGGRKNSIRKGFKRDDVTLDSMCLIAGTGHPALAQEISDGLDKPLTKTEISRFADGEVSIQILENLRDKDVFIIQPCVAPVNDSIMELLLTVSCARRAGARRIVAVIPYFGYKHYRRSTPLSTKLNSRFLSSSAVDFAHMLQEMGVDRVISVEIQRPGQGHEACFFDNAVPLETAVTTDAFTKHLIKNHVLKEPVAVVTPNAEYHKKARKFQKALQKSVKSEVKLGMFFDTKDSTFNNTNASELDIFGIDKIEGHDVLIVDDLIETGGTLRHYSDLLKKGGARNIYVCASHGVLTHDSIQHINESSIEKVFVLNTLPLPSKVSDKVQQITIGPQLTELIRAEHFSSITFEDEQFESGD